MYPSKKLRSAQQEKYKSENKKFIIIGTALSRGEMSFQQIKPTSTTNNDDSLTPKVGKNDLIKEPKVQVNFDAKESGNTL